MQDFPYIVEYYKQEEKEIKIFISY